VSGQPNPMLAPLMTQYDVVWCPEHLEPYREQWPLGAPTATVYLVELCAERVGADDDYVLLSRLVELSPLCCFVDALALKGIYSKTVPA